MNLTPPPSSFESSSVRRSYLLTFKRSIHVTSDGCDALIISESGQVLRVHDPAPWARDILNNLARNSMTEDELIESAIAFGCNINPAQICYILEAIERRGLLKYTFAPEGSAVATLEPLSRAFRFKEVNTDGTFRLSRFAYMRRLDANVVFESPLSHARLIIHNGSAAALFTLFAEPQTTARLGQIGGAFDATITSDFLLLLANAHIVLPCGCDGRLPEDENIALRQWAFHDLLFHSRSRKGRCEDRGGGTFRFKGVLSPLPASKPPMSRLRIGLLEPNHDTTMIHDASFTEVSEDRRSLRTRNILPITIAQLGEFLYRVIRTKQFFPADADRGVLCESVRRPCASGGAIHAIELYLTVTRCDGLEAGFYHYDAFSHALEFLGGIGPTHEAILADACASASVAFAPDVLITLAVRHQRVAWKYQSIAYAMILKEVGVLYHQMYLVATAMRLAPCALGTGNSDLFADASGLDYYTETSVGEFILSRR
jgi:oxazoline/thiazoline dehydrogenase